MVAETDSNSPCLPPSSSEAILALPHPILQDHSSQTKEPEEESDEEEAVQMLLVKSHPDFPLSDSGLTHAAPPLISIATGSHCCCLHHQLLLNRAAAARVHLQLLLTHAVAASTINRC